MKRAWLLLLFLVCARVGAQEPPALQSASDGALLITKLPTILVDEEVQDHLGTGLTTTFAFQVTVRDQAGRKMKGGARIEIRYDLWDEEYHLAGLGIDGRRLQHVTRSFDDLTQRWRELQLAVLRKRDVSQMARDASRRPARIELQVIPFSGREQRDTQRWFSESIGQSSGGNAEDVANSSDRGGQALGDVFNLLMATSIQRRAVQTYRWQVTDGLPSRVP